jgi:molybdenum cofactor cytidylyltransferase
MPLVSRAHVEVLLCAGAGEAIVASGAEGQAMPPALFPACQFPSLFELHGDRGARALLHGALLVPFAPGEGIDVDDPAALSRLRSAATSVG